LTVCTLIMVRRVKLLAPLHTVIEALEEDSAIQHFLHPLTGRDLRRRVTEHFLLFRIICPIADPFGVDVRL